MDSPQVAVIGAGIIGLSSAIAIQEKFPSLPITIISEKFSPDTTGDGAAGLWEPYLTGATDLQLARKWSHATYNKFRELWMSKEGPKLGLSQMPITCVNSKNVEEEAEILHHGILGYQVLDEKQLARLSEQHGNTYRSGYQFITFTCESRKYLPLLLSEFVKKGGKVERRKVTSLQELAEEGYGVVVNCPGLQAEDLVADRNVFPIRGQTVMVHAPWQQDALVCQLDESDFVVIPNQDVVFLGGTSQKNNRNTQVSPSDRKKILEGCYKMIPSLKKAKIVKEWVGLRPGRTSVRLDSGEPIIDSNGRTTFLPNDMDNYIQYLVMGSVSQVHMKPGCVPTKFECQPDRRKRTSNTVQRPYILNKRRKRIVEESEKDLEERSTVTTNIPEPEEIPSGSSGSAQLRSWWQWSNPVLGMCTPSCCLTGRHLTQAISLQILM